MNQALLFGSGSVGRLGRVLDRIRADRVFLVTGRSSYTVSGAADALEPSLNGRVLTRFSDFKENPRFEDVERGVTLLRSGAFDAVVAVGGGTVLDMAKLVNVLAAQKSNTLAIVQGQAALAASGLPLVAVPTTAGSGSEATHFGVVYVNDTKYSVADACMLPSVAIIDPDLTESLPASTTATSGIDAFSQAVESYWCIHSTAESCALAGRAIRLALDYLPQAVHTPTRRARRAMSKAAYLAGRAINITKTTAPHALSYALTSGYGVPHGQAVCLTLAGMLEYNSRVTDVDTTDPRGANHVRRAVGEIVSLLGCGSAAQASARIEAFIRSVGLKTRLSESGIPTDQVVEHVMRNVNIQRMANNPRALNDTALRALLSAVC